MKIFSSSPYATFNSKEWNSLSKINYKFSNTPIKVQKKYFETFKNNKSNEIIQENRKLPMQMKLALV